MMNGPKSLWQVIVLAAVGVLLYPSGLTALCNSSADFQIE